VSHVGTYENTFNISMERAEGKRVSGKPRRKGDDDIEIDHREIAR
jgi:hypothetical protein